MNENNTENITVRKGAPLWQKLALVLGGIALALCLVTLLLALFPGLIRGTDPQQRTEAGVSVHVTFRHSNGDLFVALPGRVRPPADDAVLASFDLSWDADGFRVPALQADHYPIAAFGDSFTEGTNVAMPWPDKLAEILGVPVRNYGYRAYGPQEVGKTATEFAAQEPRTWILYGFFAGNDLNDANRLTLLPDRSPFFRLPQLAEQAAEQMSTQVALQTSDHYDFPMPVIIGGNYYEMVFLTYFLFYQNAPPEGFAASRTFKVFTDVLDTISAETESACHGLIFIPSKEQLYYPYIYPSERQWLRANAYSMSIDQDGWLHIESEPLKAEDEENFIAHLTDQRDAVAQAVAERPDWVFIDLLPVFQAQVDAGALLYYPYDSHWNQAGHDLAASTIAAAMNRTADCPIRQP